MSAALAVLRLGWQRRRHGSPWSSLAILLVLPTALLGFALLPRISLGDAIGFAGLGLLSTLWFLFVDSLLTQNRPQLARHLPAQLRWLRLLLLGVALAVALLALLLLRGMTGQPAAVWAPAVALVVLGLAWLAWQPWLWAVGWIVPFWLPAPLKLLLQSGQQQPWLMLGLCGLALLPMLGSGGGLHRRADGWQRGWLAGTRTTRTGSPSQSALGGGLARWFCWPLHAWRRHLVRHASPANAVARLDAWLAGSGHWSVTVWSLALFLALLAGLFFWLLLGQRVTEGPMELARNMSASLLSFSGVLIGCSTQGPKRLQATRREQALLTLLPGLPAAAELGSALRWQWLRQALLCTLVAILLGGVLMLLARPQLVAFVAAFFSLLLFAPLLLMRDWSRPARAAGWDIAALLVAAALAMLANALLPWPAWCMPALAAPLALSLLVWRWRVTLRLPAQLPAGRRAA